MTRLAMTNFLSFIIALVLGVAASILPLMSSHEHVVVQQVPTADSRSAAVPSPSAGPRVVQSEGLKFKTAGKVIVEAIEEDGQYPVINFKSEKTGESIFRSVIADREKWLENKFNEVEIRFTIIDASSQHGPMVMAVGVFHGGSDDAFLATIFGEIDGKIVRLNDEPYFANVQGGFYFGELGPKLGTGFAVWTFIWGQSVMESHYSDHRYEMDVYQLKGSKLFRTIHRNSKRMYAPDKANESLRELGIKVSDQRKQIPDLKELIDVEP